MAIRVPHLDVQLTQEAVSKIRRILATAHEYEAAKQITRAYLGARPLSRETALFGFWVPGLVDGDLVGKADRIKLELFTPAADLDLRRLRDHTPQRAKFRRAEVQLAPVGDHMVGVVTDIQVGSKEQLGALYWLSYRTDDGTFIIRDPLVASTPFGIYAPGELFDVDGMLSARTDYDYYRTFYKTILPDGTYRAKDVGTCLEIHTETATKEGTLEALTDRYRQIGLRLQANIDAGERNPYAGLSPADMNFVAFDSIELTPEVPPAEREAIRSETGEFFQVLSVDDDQATVLLRHPDISNWGYDTPVLGSAAVNPSILATLRPNEFLAFIETLHTLPGRPIQLCIDSVLGHCDFQGARLLETFEQPSADRTNLKYVNSKYLRGPNMYGRDIDFTEPHVKAILLELLVRKLNYGFDCLRVDGAQDFILEMDEGTGLRIQADAYLNEMSNVIQEIRGPGGTLRRRLDINLEDGRPWPDDLNWLYNSKYLDHTIERSLPCGDRVKQWSPIIFAHNVHGKYKWFMDKWDRFVEVYRYGEDWITGQSNHDNARYFYRMVEMTPSSAYRKGDAFADYYNDQLGESMPEVAHNALDHNGLTALMLGFLPGNPLFLLNALFHTPWLFMRDIDATYDVKIVGDEGARFMTWYVDTAIYDDRGNFQRLKALGFETYRQLVAPADEKANDPGFLDALLRLCLAIKTDALMARFLFEDPEEAGGFEDVSELRNLYQSIVVPKTEEEARYRDRLKARLDADPREAARRVKAARRLLGKNKRFLARDSDAARGARLAGLRRQMEKLVFVESLDDRDLGLLIEDADYRTEYKVATWSWNEELNALAPLTMKVAGRLTTDTLKAFARAFMLDARDVAKVHLYESSVDPARAAYNLGLRRFRQENPWLRRNPTNDVQRDYFARKLFINGAKDVGDWGDKGDIVNCNTIYYGWRTSPDDTMQVFLIANMEGRPIDRCPLNLFLNLDGPWNVVVHSPTLQGIPERIDRAFVLEDFKNGEALLLARDVP